MEKPIALLSVSDKTGLVEIGQGLVDLGWELLASGGTAQALLNAGLPVKKVAEWTGFPEILGGRVKTLHPAIHAGLLARDTPEDQAELERLGLCPIDLVACNLYPFARTVARENVTLSQAIEQIDIGGVTLLRAAAKNFERVTVLVNPDDYTQVLTELQQQQQVSWDTRGSLAYKAFAHTASYDQAIRSFLQGQGFDQPAQPFPETLDLQLELAQSLRYGENPHQQAALYRFAGTAGPLGGKLLQGKPLSYNNLLDLESAWRLVQEYQAPTLAILKHTNPCGLASATTLAEAFDPALAGDPVSAFGSILGANRTFDAETTGQLGDLFVEAIVAPDFTPEALKVLSSRTNLRLLEISEPPPNLFSWEARSIRGGLLVQDADAVSEADSTWQVVTKRSPDEKEWSALHFVWRAVGHVKSNAIALAQSNEAGAALVGVGAGQMSRVDAVHMATWKAGERAQGAMLASDAFFPFPDGVEAAAQAGVTAIIQPGGSVRDDQVIAVADQLGLAMVFTGRRHFRH
jgi:phosphoribosylaminoimidazolecarboxamide formyltransferase/IMP cyclohydrolase